MARRQVVGVNADSVTVEGLREFRSALRRAGFTRALSAANQRAGDLVATRARTNMAGTPQGSGRYVARTIKARKLARAVVVDMGGAGGVRRHPTVYQTAAINEFGTQNPAYRSRGFEPWVGNRYTVDPEVGYVLGRAIRDNAEQFIEFYGDQLEQVAAEAFPN